MTLRGTIYDAVSGEAIPYASVIVTDQYGNPTGKGVTSDGGGFYTLSFNELTDPYGRVAFSTVGYEPEDMHYTGAQGYIFLGKKSDALGAVYVVFKKKAKDGTLANFIGAFVAIMIVKYFKII